MHDLLSFMPRPRMNHTPSDDLKRTVSALVNDIQVLAADDKLVVLQVLAQFAHEERLRLTERVTDESREAHAHRGGHLS